MVKMTDMKYSAKEKKERNSPMEMMSKGSDGPDYPYGLSLNLEHEHLTKLGMDKLPKVGATMRVHAKAVVTSVSQSDNHRGKPSRRIELQLQHIGLEDHKPGSAEEAIDQGIKDADE